MIPVYIINKRFLSKFYVGNAWPRNYLGSDFLWITKASIMYQKDSNLQVFKIDDVTFNLEYLYLHELSGNAGMLDESQMTYAAQTPDQLVKDNLSFTQTA